MTPTESHFIALVCNWGNEIITTKLELGFTSQEEFEDVKNILKALADAIVEHGYENSKLYLTIRTKNGELEKHNYVFTNIIGFETTIPLEEAETTKDKNADNYE